jgi:hypothetical protein
MFDTNKITKKRQAQKNMYLEKILKDRTLKEKQILQMIDYTNHLINTRQYNLDTTTSQNNTSQNNTSQSNTSQNITDKTLIEYENITEKKEPEIYTYKNNVLEWSNDYEREPDKYMARLIEIINKILNNDIDTYTYRDLIKDDLTPTNYNNIFLAIENSKKNYLPINYNISEVVSNVKIPLLMLENNNETIINSNDRVVELELENDNNTNQTSDKKGKKKFNFNKINQINNDSQNNRSKNNKNIITKDTLIDKLNSLVKKVNDKVETEISKDVFMISQSITEKSSENIVNIICSMILDKIEKVIG